LVFAGEGSFSSENLLPKPPRHLLDLGTGTGCLLLSLLHEWPEATGLGIDLAPRAVEQAQENARRLSLDTRAIFQEGNWLEGLTETFDLIVSNPPYIPAMDIDTLAPEVRQHDPSLALDGGKDGLDPYRHLIPLLPNFLNPNGATLFEVGLGQAEAVASSS
jgi:release factor glutamine methyltransferase